MSNEQTPPRDALDDKVNQVFAGKVVRKDLVRKIKVGANVPVFVLEYLLGKYCASSDEMSIQMGLQVVNDTLAENYIRPDEATKAQSRVKEKGRHTFIDKVKVRLVDSDYWAEVNNFGHHYVHIPDQYVREYDRMLMGGIWAQVDMRFEYDEQGKGKYPFWIDKLTPIQLATFDLDEYRRLRRQFTTDEWIDFMMRSMGYEPTEMSRRLKLLFLLRLVPLCEQNYNLVELGPRGTGKSYAVQEISPYAALLTGPTTVANLFGHMNGKQKGMVMIWDTVAFDEVADLEKMPKEVITTLKTYCESGQFQRGHEAMAGYASIAMFGNTQQPIDVMVQTGHLFAPMPATIRDDMAFLDRMHYYLPGWEIPKMRNEHFTDHYGFVVDYMAEALRELRKHNFTELIDHHFSFGSHLNARDRKAVRRTVSGMVKVLHPHGEASPEDLEEILAFAMEGRRRVKEQLKKMGSFEYYHTSFSYSTNETGAQGITLHLCDMGGTNLDTRSSMGKIMLTLLAAFAEFERTLIAERTSAALSHKKRNGQLYNHPPFGFQREGKQLVPHEAEQKVLKHIFQCRKDGLSLYDIANRLNDLGVPSKKGGKWHAATIAHIVNNDLYRDPADNLIPWQPLKKPVEPAESQFLGQLAGVIKGIGDDKG